LESFQTTAGHEFPRRRSQLFSNRGDQSRYGGERGSCGKIRHPEPLLLRIYYDAKDDGRAKSWADISGNYRDVSYWAILDDLDLFNYEGSNSSWLQVFNILPAFNNSV
jgi:hypothetical protein